MNSRSLQTTIIFLVVGGILALALGGFFGSASRQFSSVLIEVQTWISSRFLGAQDFLTAPRDIVSLRTRNAELETQVSQLQTQVIELQQRVSQTDILAALVDFASTNPESKYKAAAVIGRDPSPFLHYIIINRGSNDDIRRGMPVVTNQGLVGRVDAVIADASQNAVVQPGDLILTSGLGGGYPSDIIIGQVITIRSLEFELFQQATIQPAVDFSRLAIVLVITNFRSVDIAPLEPQTTP